MANTPRGGRPDAREYRGEWWTVDDPASRLHGTFSRGGMKAELVVHGGLLDVSDAARPVILGEAGGTQVTIINYSSIRTTTQENGALTQTLDVGEFLLGGLVPKPESQTFTVVEMDSHTLRALGQMATRPKLEKTDDAPNEYSVRISVPPLRSGGVEALGRITLGWHIRSSHGVTSGSLEAWPVVRLEATAGLTMDDTWQRFVVPVVFLLALASGCGDRIEAIRLANEDQEPESSPMEWHGLPWIGEGDQPPPAGMFQALLSYDDIAEGLDSLLPRWFRLFEQAGTALIDFFSVPMSRSLYVEDSVLRTVRAIEGYHRSIIGGKYFEEQQFKTLVDLLKKVARTPSERNFVTMRMQNVPTLKQRLDAFVDRAGEPLAHLIGEFDAFTRRVKDVRNSLAHDGALGDAFTEPELFFAEKALQLLMRAVLLRDLGMDGDEIAKRIRRSEQWHTLSAPDNPLLLKQ